MLAWGMPTGAQETGLSGGRNVVLGIFRMTRFIGGNTRIPLEVGTDRHGPPDDEQSTKTKGNDEPTHGQTSLC